MLLNFSVKNYASFKDEAFFDLVSYNKLDHNPGSVFYCEDIGVLKSAVIFGANASGKTNLLNAFLTFKRILLYGTQQTAELTNSGTNANEYNPFLLADGTDKEPVEFKIEFYSPKTKIFYTYELHCLPKDIVHESLNKIDKKGKDVNLFTRKGEVTSFQEAVFPEGKGLSGMKAFRTSVPTVTAAYNLLKDLVWSEVMTEFKNIVPYFNSRIYKEFNRELLKDNYRQRVSDMIRHADFSIDNIICSEKEESDERGVSYNLNVEFEHSKFNSAKQKTGSVLFEYAKESSGTKNYFRLVQKIIEVLNRGGLLLVDELERSLHPMLMEKIVEVFNSSENKLGAQLIFTTHNTHILSPDIFRRDQVWFTEKDKYGASRLISLLEFSQDSRTDHAWEKRYLKGMYGAVSKVKSLPIRVNIRRETEIEDE